MNKGHRKQGQSSLISNSKDGCGLNPTELSRCQALLLRMDKDSALGRGDQPQRSKYQDNQDTWVRCQHFSCCDVGQGWAQLTPCFSPWTPWACRARIVQLILGNDVGCDFPAPISKVPISVRSPCDFLSPNCLGRRVIPQGALLSAPNGPCLVGAQKATGT